MLCPFFDVDLLTYSCREFFMDFLLHTLLIFVISLQCMYLRVKYIIKTCGIALERGNIKTWGRQRCLCTFENDNKFPLSLKKNLKKALKLFISVTFDFVISFLGQLWGERVTFKMCICQKNNFVKPFSYFLFPAVAALLFKKPCHEIFDQSR